MPLSPPPFEKALRRVDGVLRGGLAWGLRLASLSGGGPYRQLWRTLLFATLVGAVAGAASGVFSLAVIHLQHLVLDGLAGITALRAAGERTFEATTTPFRPWMILFLPAIGAGLGGFIAYHVAHETAGGGGDSAIRAYHQHDAIARHRIPFVKALVSILTVGFGGSGGRAGPTMQIGSAIGSVLARWLRTSARERRVLYVAGIAAGVSAVFRTPLGAALFAVEVLYRDDFESEALVPAVLASVAGYSVSLLFGEPSQLFAHAASYPFVPGHLPLFALLALCEVGIGILYLGAMGAVWRGCERLPGPIWMRPGFGGLALGFFLAPVLYLFGTRLSVTGMGFGLLGGGFGAAQMAMAGAPFLPDGWAAVRILGLLCLVKLVATSLTLGTRGSAGNFAPTLVIGALLGGAFGRAAALLTGDPRIDPGAFALVGMGTLFGGIGHVPISSMVFVCEMAGSYDLIVPLMLAEGIAFVALRQRHLFPSQPPRRRGDDFRGAEVAASGASAGELVLVQDVMDVLPAARTFAPATRGRVMLEAASVSDGQAVFVVLDEGGALVGLVPTEELHRLSAADGMAEWIVASDLMQEAVSASPGEPAREALGRMITAELRQIPVLAEDGQIRGYVDERRVAGRLLVPRA